MTGAKIEYHTKVVFTLKSLEDASSVTFVVSNIQESDTSGIVWPILKAIGQIGASMGDFLPNTSTSSITLKNGHGSIGHERRFSDLLERYSLINQQVLVYVAASAIGSFTSGDYELRWAGIAKRVRSRGDELTIDIAGRGIQDWVINTMVSSQLFSNAPSSSLGYALPVVIGQNVQVKPVVIDATSSNSIQYAYASNKGDYCCAGTQSIYAKGTDGKYDLVTSAASVTTLLYGNSYVAGKSNLAIGATKIQFAIKFTVSGSYGHLITGGSWWLYKAAGTDDGSLKAWIAEEDLIQTATLTKAPGTILAEGVLDTATLAAGAAVYECRVNFKNVAVLKPNKNYFFCYEYTGGTALLLNHYYDNAASQNIYTQYDNIPWFLSVGKQRYYGLYGCKIYDIPVSLPSSWQGLRIDQNTSLSDVPDLSKVDLILEVNGLKDDGLGTVTGVASQLIESAQHAVELLSKPYSGGYYSGGQFGTEHSSTWSQVNTSTSTFYRKIAGKTTGVTKLSQFLDQVCRASASRITMHPSASTPMGFWAWGGTASVIDDIDQDSCSILGIEILGTESVINAVEMFYAEKIGADYVTGAALGEFKTFSGRINSGDSTQTYYDAMNRASSTSRSIFGTNYLDNRTQPWIGDLTSATNLALSLLIRFGFPSVFYDIELPYTRFKALKLLDVVRITHPGMAAFFGTTPKASKAIYDAGGVEVDISTGFHWARASSSRFQIEALSVVFDSENTPRIRASVRLLNNPNDPT